MFWKNSNMKFLSMKYCQCRKDLIRIEYSSMELSWDFNVQSQFLSKIVNRQCGKFDSFSIKITRDPRKDLFQVFFVFQRFFSSWFVVHLPKRFILTKFIIQLDVISNEWIFINKYLWENS